MKLSKGICWSLVFLLLLGVGIQPGFARVKDVPTDHWAYQAVVTLVDKGYLAVYEDGTFQGTSAVDRYTLAVAIDRILDDIQAAQVSPTSDDPALLRKLTTEFREELAKWYAEQGSMEDRISHAVSVSQATDDRLNRVVAFQVELEDLLTDLKLDFVTEGRETEQILEDHQNRLDRQGADILTQTMELEEHELKLGELQSALVELDGMIRLQAEAVKRLENFAGEQSAVAAALSLEDSLLQQSIDALSEEIDGLSIRIGTDLELLVQDLETTQGQLAQQISAQDGQLESLAQDKDSDIEALQEQIDTLAGAMAASDGQFIRDLEHQRVEINKLGARNQELERDLQSIAVRLQRETQTRTEQQNLLITDLEAELTNLYEQIEILSTQVGISEDELAALNRKISEEILLQMSTTLIREQRLERQLQDLQEEFTSFRIKMEEDNSSARSSARTAMVMAAVGIAIAIILNY